MTSPFRRRLVVAGLALPLCGTALAQPLTCGSVTPPETEGPFFKPRSPRRTSLLEGSAKNRLIVTGQVLSRECEPVLNALLDFWHADESGEYDNQGFRYRGHQFTDAEGRYRLETIVPAEYPGRTRHIHVKLQAPKKKILTTQLYFPGDPGNRRDALYLPELAMRMAAPDAGQFDFVIEA
jgi:protocatechuate 3,4-dioxygenase beta subunit